MEALIREAAAGGAMRRQSLIRKGSFASASGGGRSLLKWSWWETTFSTCRRDGTQGLPPFMWTEPVGFLWPELTDIGVSVSTLEELLKILPA